MKNSEIKFKLGEEFTEDRVDGAKVKVIEFKSPEKLLI